MNKKQQGFSVVEVIVAILVLAVLGGIGWFVLNSKKDADKSPGTTQQTSSGDKKDDSSQDPYKEWVTYTNEEYGYAFKYPKTWKTSDAVNQRGTTPGQPKRSSLTIESSNLVTTTEGVGFHLTAGAEMVVTVADTDKTTPTAYIEASDFLNRNVTDKKSVVAAGQEALRYTLHYEGSPSLTTLVVSNGKAYSISLSYAKDDSQSYEAAVSAYQDDYENLVKSFKLL